MTNQVDERLAKAEDIFKSLIWDHQVDAALLALHVSVPFTSWPILSNVIDFILRKFAEQLFSTVRLFVDLGAIRLLNAEHQKEYESASIKLRIVAHDHGISSPEFQEARNAAKDALSKYAKFLG